MPTREEIDLELLRFLRDAKDRDPEKIDRELDGIKNAVSRTGTEVQLLRQGMEARDALINERLTGMNARIDKLEEDVEDTGVHNLETLKAKADWWQSTATKVVVPIILAIILGGGGFLFGALLHRGP